MAKIKGSVVVVTGASSGNGAAIAKAMAKAGGRVALLARSKDALDKVAAEIASAGSQAKVYPVDLADSGAVAAVAKRITQELGAPDIIVNNAGSGRWLFVDETSPREAVQMMAVPYFAAFNVTHAFLPGMLKRNSGHIVNISSVGSRFVWPGATAYLAARWAVRGFTEALRADLDGTGIGVTLYESGVVRSPYWENNPGSRERVPKMGNLVPELTTEQVGQAIVKGVERNSRLIVIPFMMKMTYWQHAVFPRVVQWLMTKTGYRRKPV
ncbi:MAG TPA: SDR family NAD(P)-dependent oxidoreductase [Burkholderiales bacterium]|nr:SDR family NAD(P)-dependent oxidoreductase [Burkholderiales bacterium]